MAGHLLDYMVARSRFASGCHARRWQLNDLQLSPAEISCWRSLLWSVTGWLRRVGY